MVKDSAPAPPPPLPPWQRLHKPVVPAKTTEEIEAEKTSPEGAAEMEAPPAAAAAGVVPTDLPSDEPNQKKSSGVATTSASLAADDVEADSITGEINKTHQPSTSEAPVAASKNKKKKGPPSKKSNGRTSDSDSDDEPTFKEFKAVKCPRTSVSAEAYAKRLREKEEAEKESNKRGGKAAPAKREDDVSPVPPLHRRGKRDRGNIGSQNDASADDIDALAITVAESSESFDVAAAVAKMPPKQKKKPAKSKAPPEKKSAPPRAKASKKTDAKSAAKKPAAAAAVASTSTATKRISTKGKALPEEYLNALENGLDEEGTPYSSSPQRTSRRQRTQVVPFTIKDAPASSAVHGEHTTEEQVTPAKTSSKESKKRKAAEPPAAAANKATKVSKKDQVASKKRKAAEQTEPAAANKAKKVAKKDHVVAEEDDEEEAYLPPLSNRALHVTAKMEATWNERMKMLREHKEKYGTTDLTVAEKAEVNQLLRSFVFEQRKQHKKYMSGKHSSLSAERIKELTDLGFEFDPMSSGTHKVNSMRRFNQQWDEMYDELVQFKNVHGNTLVPLGKKAKEEIKKLGNWVRGQRKLMNKIGREKFDPQRLAKLEAIGFDWNPLASGTYSAKKRADLFPRVNEKWMSWYKKLKGFKDKHGHIIVGPTTKNYPGLYNWIHGQRKEYIKYQNQEPHVNMYDEWVKLLDDLGFDWAPMSKGGKFSDMLKNRTSQFFESKWDSHYKDLCKFREENGHCYVFRTGDNATLAGWVHCQRKQKKLLDDGKHSQLNPQRIELLDKIEFDWRPSESGGIEKLRSPERNLEWDQLFELLKEYKEKTGHCSPKKKEPKIGNWVSSQRRLWARNQKGETTTLNEERIAKLQSIGFEFSLANDESSTAEDNNFSVHPETM